MPQTKVNTTPFINTIKVKSHAIALSKGKLIEKLAKINMDPLYASNYRWSYIHPDLKHEGRSGLARASIHTKDRKSEYRILIGSNAEAMKKGFPGIAGSKTNYFPYLEFGTWAIPPLGMLRSAFDEVRRGGSTARINW